MSNSKQIKQTKGGFVRTSIYFAVNIHVSAMAFVLDCLWDAYKTHSFANHVYVETRVTCLPLSLFDSGVNMRRISVHTVLY